MKKKLKVLLFILLLSILSIIFRSEIYIMINNISDSFFRTVIEEERYKLLFQGFISTTIISIASITLGTLLGLIIYCINKNKLKILRKFGNFYVRVMQGVPVTVLSRIVAMSFCEPRSCQ